MSENRLPQAQSRVKLLLHSLSHWLYVIWKDIFWMAVLMLPILFLLMSRVFKQNDRLFPMWKDPQTGLWVGPIEYSYPPRPMVVNTLLCSLVLLGIPLAIFTVMQFFVRSVWDWTAASLGLLEAIALMSLIQVITKQYVGAFRPYFLSACNPDTAILEELARQSATSAGNEYLPYHRVFATSRICHPVNKHLLWKAMHSWPSGHTGTAFAVGIFLSLYLNAKLKAFSNYRTGFWKMFAITAPFIGAILIAGGLTIDHNHHASDILTSIPLGIFAGLLAYRAKYLSLFDYRTNHIPLVHGGIGQSVPPPVQPVGDYAAIPWPKPPLRGLPLNSRNLPGGAGGLDGAIPNLPTSAPTRPGLPSAGTNETVVPISRRRQSPETSSSEENDVRVNARAATGQRAEQMV